MMGSRVSGPRSAWWGAVDAIVMSLVLLGAARFRTGWSDLPINEDWYRFFEFANGLDHLLEFPPDPQMRFYTSIPFLLFAAIVRVFDDPERVLVARATLGALAAPVSYLAARRLAGPGAGIAVGVLVATSAGDCHVQAGLETPGPTSLFTACVALGVVAGTSKRPWGPPLLIFGAAMAVSHHTGLWPLAPLACLIALVQLHGLPRRGKVLAGAAALVLGGSVSVIVVWFDAARLANDLAVLDETARGWGEFTLDASDPFSRQDAGHGVPRTFLDLLFTHPCSLGERARFGLNVTPAASLLVVSTSLVGCLLLLLRVLRHTRRQAGGRRKIAVPYPAEVLLLALLGAGMMPYVSMAAEHAYLISPHMIAFLPLAAVSVVGSARSTAQYLFPRLGGVFPVAVAGAWFCLVEFAPEPGVLSYKPPLVERVGRAWAGREDPPDRVPDEHAGPRPLSSFQAAAALSGSIRGEARGRARRPVVFGWFERDDPGTPRWFTNLVQEMALSGWRTTGLPPACYLVLDEQDVALVDHGRLIPTQPDTPFAVLEFESCGDLAALEEQICGLDSRRTVLGWRSWPPFDGSVLGCTAYSMSSVLDPAK